MAGADLPCLIANIMRGGPGLGNIAGAQGDYIQATRGGGNGDYRTFVLAPYSVQELANFPKKAFELAEKYRIPAMILADGILGQMMEGMSFDFDPVDPASLPKPAWAIGAHGAKRKRNMVYSYALEEGGLEKMVLKRAERYALIERDEVLYEERHTEDAEILVVAYGISARASIAAVNIAREKGIKAGLLRPVTLWPFPTKRIKELAGKVKCMLCAEMSMGQMKTDVDLAVAGKCPVYLHARPGAFFPVSEEIAVAIEAALKGGKEQLFSLEELAKTAKIETYSAENPVCKEGVLL
jgi:2-oxoglutarate ferredoxin oxidoreductase subunit alpha